MKKLSELNKDQTYIIETTLGDIWKIEYYNDGEYWWHAPDSMTTYVVTDEKLKRIITKETSPEYYL